jgi:hypothetical protein
MPPMGNNCIAVMRADAKAARTRLLIAIHKLAARRFCTPTKNAAVYAASRAHLVFLARLYPVGSKKRSSASSFAYNSACPGFRGSHFYDAGTGRTDGSFVLKKAHHFWIWIALCRKTRQVVAYAVGDRSKRTCLRLWEAIPSVSSSGALLHRLLGSIRGSDPGGAAFRCGKRDGGDCPCGALE